MDEARALASGVDLDALIDGYARGLMPLGEAEPGGRSARDPSKAGKLSSGLADDLALIATAINPTIGTEQADAWVKVMTTALSDLPGRVAREAVQAALRRPIAFFSEVHGVVRERAGHIEVRHRVALRRLHALRKEMNCPSLPAPPSEDEAAMGELSDDELRGFSEAYLKLGIAKGFVSAERVSRLGLGSGQPPEGRAEDEVKQGECIVGEDAR